MKKAFVLALITLVAVASVALAAPGKLAIGATQGVASLKYQFTPDVTGTLGLNNFSGNLVGNGTGILIKGEYNLAKSGQVQPNIGIYYTTDGAAAAMTTLGITYGVSTMVQDNLSLGVDILLLGSYSRAGVNGTGILPGINLAAAYYL